MHYAVIDLGYGDAGKGITTARLCATRDIDWVVRTSGGCQAAHNVIANDGRHHTFAQFGAGTFSGVKTFLSKYMMVEPFSLLIEAEALEAKGIKDPLKMVTIDPDALMTTPYHWELNQWQEDLRLGNGVAHGSTGRGIGMTSLYALEAPHLAPRVGDIFVLSTLRKKLGNLRLWCLSMGCPADRLPSTEETVQRYRAIESKLQVMKMAWGRILDQDQIVFEGAQGVLLDQDHGFHPHTTWSRTTDANVHAFLRDASSLGAPLTTIGVTRTYMTRHGAGPFVTEQPQWETVETHNKAEHFQGGWRQGYPDLVALHYSIECCNNIDALYVTHTDAPSHFMDQVAIAYSDGHELFKVEHLVGREVNAERQKQTEALSRLQPMYVPLDPKMAAESLSAALWLPLYGKGWGPRIDEGVIQLD